MANVGDVVQMVEQLGSSALQLLPERCSRIRNHRATCDLCEKRCPTQAITIKQQEIKVKPGACFGCGVCSTVCPTGSINMRVQPDPELIAQCEAAVKACDGILVIGCSTICEAASGKIDPERVVKVPCLGRIDAGTMTVMASKGTKRIQLVYGNCNACRFNGAQVTIEETCNATVDYFEAWDAPTEFRVSDKFPSVARAGQAGYNSGRRKAFFNAKDNASNIATVMGTKAVKDMLGMQEPSVYHKLRADANGKMPRHTPSRHARLSQSLQAMGEPEDILICTPQYAQVVIDLQKCISCQMCVKFCPVGALETYTSSKGVRGVAFSVSECTNCGTCQDICLKKAITLDPEVFAIDIANDHVEGFAKEPTPR